MAVILQLIQMKRITGNISYFMIIPSKNWSSAS